MEARQLAKTDGCGAARRLASALLGALLLGGVSAACASGRVLRVGADKEYKKPSAAITAAQAGDTIVIDEGVWTDDTIYCPKTPDVTIRGAGIDRTVLDAINFNAQSAGDSAHPHIAGWKGIWVVTAPGWTIEGITFRNARIPPDAGGNGAGIRYEADGDVTFRNCSFTGCQNGILCGAYPNATMVVEGCLFRDNGNHPEWNLGECGYTHNIYIGAIKELVFRNCVSDHACIGHNLKSRAYKTTVENCVFDDGHDGRSSYLLNCPNGGVVTITGCTFVQAETAANGVMISIGEEGSYAMTKLVQHDNTFTDYRGGTIWRLAFTEGLNDTPMWEYGSYAPSDWKPSAENALFGVRTSTDGLSYFAGDRLANDVASLTDGYIPTTLTSADVVGLGDYSHLWFPLNGEKLKSLTIRSFWEDGTHDGMYVRNVQVQIDGKWVSIAGEDAPGVPTGDCGRNGYDDASGWTSAVKLGGSNSSGHLFLRLKPKTEEYIASNVTGIHIEFRMMDGSDPRGTGFAEIEADCVTERKTSGSVTYTDRGVSVVEEGSVFACTHTADFTLGSDMQVTVERFAAGGAQIASETKTFGAGATVTVAVRAGERARVTFARASVLAIDCDAEELSAAAKARIRDLVSDRLGGDGHLQLRGPKGAVELSAWMGIAPSISGDAKGSAIGTYAMPAIVITGFDPAAGRMRIRVEPGKDNALALPAETRFIHVFGSESLPAKMGYVSSVDFDASQYLASGTMGELDATVALARRRFLKVVAETTPRLEGEFQ